MLIVYTDTKVTQNVFHTVLKITLQFCLTIMSAWQCYSYLLCMNSMITIFGLASARSYMIDVVGNNNWLVGNAVFSEMALRIFLIFCMKLGNYKGRKVTIFSVFGLNLVLNMTFNLNETYFSEKFAIWKLPKLRFLAISSTLHH